MLPKTIGELEQWLAIRNARMIPLQFVAHEGWYVTIVHDTTDATYTGHGLTPDTAMANALNKFRLATGVKGAYRYNPAKHGSSRPQTNPVDPYDTSQYIIQLNRAIIDTLEQRPSSGPATTKLLKAAHENLVDPPADVLRGLAALDKAAASLGMGPRSGEFRHAHVPVQLVRDAILEIESQLERRASMSLFKLLHALQNTGVRS